MAKTVKKEKVVKEPIVEKEKPNVVLEGPDPGYVDKGIVIQESEESAPVFIPMNNDNTLLDYLVLALEKAKEKPEGCNVYNRDQIIHLLNKCITIHSRGI